MPKAMETILTSAPTLSQILAISLMNEIFVARKVLFAYLIISAVSQSVSTSGRYVLSLPEYTFLIAGSGRSELLPITILSGKLKALMAFPSRRNSGLETTSNSIFLGRFSLIILSVSRAVPGGTVLLLTIILYLSKFSPIDLATAKT